MSGDLYCCGAPVTVLFSESIRVGRCVFASIASTRTSPRVRPAPTPPAFHPIVALMVTPGGVDVRAPLVIGTRLVGAAGGGAAPASGDHPAHNGVDSANTNAAPAMVAAVAKPRIALVGTGSGRSSRDLDRRRTTIRVRLTIPPSDAVGGGTSMG